jgi:SRSO17 transposase
MRAGIRASGDEETGASDWLDHRRYGFSQERERIGRRGAPVLRAVGKARELPSSREFVSEHGDLQLACGLPVVLARELGLRCVAPKEDRRSGDIQFQTKPRIALDQIRQAVEQDVPRGVVLADAAYGIDSQFRAGLRELQLDYAVGVQSSLSVWEPGKQPLPAKPRKEMGRPPKLLRREEHHQPVSSKQLAIALPETAWKQITWREGSKKNLRSRFAAVRVRPAHRDYEQSEPHPEEWLLIEWPKGVDEPTRYWLSNLPAATKRNDLVRIAKHRWIVERDYEELKQELGLGHFEGRGWRGFHHHNTLCIATYGFLIAERSLFSPSVRGGELKLPVPKIPTKFQPRGTPGSLRSA